MPNQYGWIKKVPAQKTIKESSHLEERKQMGPIPQQDENVIPPQKRGIDMLLKKYHHEAFETEVKMMNCCEESAPCLKKPLSEAVIALVTDGGLVPKGNPDCIPPSNSNRFGKYGIAGLFSLSAEDFEVSHQGYDNRYVNEDPNRLLPVDSLRALESFGGIKKLYDFFYSTAGVMTPVEKSIEFGREIASDLASADVDGVILTSTCGTSTRCGSYICRQIEAVGIPVVHITTLTDIAEGFHSSNLIKGCNVNYVLGNPYLSLSEEKAMRLELVQRALATLTREPYQ